MNTYTMYKDLRISDIADAGNLPAGDRKRENPRVRRCHIMLAEQLMNILRPLKLIGYAKRQTTYPNYSFVNGQRVNVLHAASFSAPERLANFLKARHRRTRRGWNRRLRGCLGGCARLFQISGTCT